jgi:hypothetical protein
MCALERASVLNITSSLSISLLFLFVLTLNGVSTPSSDIGLRLVTVDSTNQPNAHPTENQATNPWIGIRMDNISSPLASLLGLNESTGALVTDVIPGSPAQKAGLRVPEVIINSLGQPIEVPNADIILKIDNIPVQATTDVGSTLQTKKSGDKITLDVLRDGQINQVTIIPEPKPDYFIFNDSEGLYSIRYPSNWTAVNPGMLQQLNRQSESLQQLVPPPMIQNLAATFVKPGSAASITITKNLGSAAGISAAKIELLADEGFTRALMQQNGTIIQDKECERYKVDGSKACSYVMGIRTVLPNNVLTNNVMQVLTIQGERVFVFTYRSLPENFDKDLPVLEKMLQSFSWTGTA